MKKFFLFFASLSLHSLAQAYFVATPGSQGAINFDQPTRVLVSGRGTDLNTLPQRSALGRALLYAKNFPDDQIVMISVFEGDTVEKQGKNYERLKTGGWVFPVNNEVRLDTASIMPELKKFRAIRSLEFFGHNSPSLGTQTDGLGARFDARVEGVADLAQNFTSGAFAIFHGCNSGWLIAQDLAKKWLIPVSGSFTQTRFEELHTDGHYYVNEASKAPVDAATGTIKWAMSNPVFGGLDCRYGGCVRQRSAFARYVGKWGEFEGPVLSHSKFFCHLEDTECEKRMALSLYGFLSEKPLMPGATEADFRQVAKEYLCPVYKDRKLSKECIAELGKFDIGQGNLSISYTVRNPQLTCDFKSCQAKMVCDDHICKLTEASSKNSQTLAREYLHLINGYKALQKEKGL